MRQETYDRLLVQARLDVAANPEQQCDPEYQDLLLDMIDAPNSQKVILRLALSDACIEAGEYDIDYSPYYR